MIIKIQKFVDLIVNNSDNLSFWYPLQMLKIDFFSAEAIIIIS